MTVSYFKGDATRPTGPGVKVIAHVCNNVGAWGAGFVLALNKRWIRPRDEYMKLRDPNTNMIELGTTQFVPVEPDLVVANMVAQNGLKCASNPHPLNIDALKETLSQVREYALKRGASVHMPRIGAGFGGGDWAQISGLITDAFENSGVITNIYEL